MMLTVIGCSFRNTPVAVRERLAFDGPKLAAALDELHVRYGCEAVILGTCNRVELYLARPEGPSCPTPTRSRSSSASTIACPRWRSGRTSTRRGTARQCGTCFASPPAWTA